MILAAIWLILTGLLLLNIRLSTTITTGLAILGIADGVLILMALPQESEKAALIITGL